MFFFVFCDFFFLLKIVKRAPLAHFPFPFFLIKPFLSYFEAFLPLLPLNLLLKYSLSDLGKSLTFFC